MENKVLVVTNGVVNDALVLLDNRYNIVDNINFSYDSNINIDDDRVICFVDRYVDNTKVDVLTGLDNILVIDTTRVNDLHMLSTLRNIGIDVPDYVYADNTIQYVNICENKQYVFKSFMSARSIGKTILDLDKLIDMYYSSARDDIGDKTFNKLYITNEGEYRDKNEKYKVRACIKNGAYYLQEYVDVVCEYRIISGCNLSTDEVTIFARKGYGLNKENNIDNMTTTLTNFKDAGIPESLLSNIADISMFTGLPFYSVDVYKDRNGKWGVFEYSFEFAVEHDYNSIMKIKYTVNKAFENYINVRKQANTQYVTA